jgi:hypothetical protein
MKTKLIFSSEININEQWTELTFSPRVNEWFNIQDILKTEEIATIRKTAKNWSGIKGIIKSIEYRHDDNDYYLEVNIICQDEKH